MITIIINKFKFLLLIITILCFVLPAMAEDKYQIAPDTPASSNRLPVEGLNSTYTNSDNNINLPNTLDTPYNKDISPNRELAPTITGPDSSVTVPNTSNAQYNTDIPSKGTTIPNNESPGTNTLNTPYGVTTPNKQEPKSTQVDLSVIKKILGAWKIDGDKYIGTLKFVLIDDVLTAKCYFFMYNSWQSLDNVFYDGLNIGFDYEDPLGEVIKFNGKLNKKLNRIKGTYVNSNMSKVFKWEALR